MTLVMMRIRTVITGTQGTPGLSTVYATGAGVTPIAADALDMVGRVRTFWNALITMLPSLITAQVQSQVDLIDPATGDLVGGLNPAAPAVVTGTGGAALPFAAAALLVANTGVIVNQRRLQGRTFISPLAATVNNAGNFGTAQSLAVTAAATNMLTGSTTSTPCVWHRPTELFPAAGTQAPVSGYTTRIPYAVLKSRRD